MPESVHTEDGDPLTAPEMIDTETALEVIDALDMILDDGDWWRLRNALDERAKDRIGSYKYTNQDKNLAYKFAHLDSIREDREQYEKLRQEFGESDFSSEADE